MRTCVGVWGEMWGSVWGYEKVSKEVGRGVRAWEKVGRGVAKCVGCGWRHIGGYSTAIFFLVLVLSVLWKNSIGTAVPVLLFLNF